MFLIYVLLGIVSGFLSGLIGIGGGIIIIPVLAAVFNYYSVISPADIMHYAMSTSLAIVIVSFISGMIAHHRRQGVRWDFVRRLLPALMIGAVVGVVISNFLSSEFLKRFFGIFLFGVAASLFFSAEKKITAQPFSQSMSNVISFLIGILSSTLGIGGGVLIVPFLLRQGFVMKQATGSATVCGLSVAIVATISFMCVGFFSAAKIPWATGYIYWPAFLGVAMISVFFAPLGAALAHRLPAILLKRAFAIFLVFVALDMLFL